MGRKLVLFIATLALCVSAMPPLARASDEIKYKFGIIERLRHEYWKNNKDMNSQSMDSGDRNFFRFKTSAWGQADYDIYTLFVKLTNEAKSYLYYGGNAKKGLTGESDELLFDNLYLDVKKPGGAPVDFRLGRQDLLNMYGENFLLGDGTPGDGSRTYYFNALKASWTIDKENTLDLLYIDMPKTDQYLPVFDQNKGETALSLNDELAYVVYLKNKSIKDLSIEPYYIYKHEGAASGLQSQTGEIHTAGAYSKYMMAPWTLHVQLADQFGKYGTEDRQALGGFAFIDQDFKEIPFSPVLSLGYVYLSGDDKNTSKNEGWDPLFSRFPIWSEILVTSFTGESGVGYWTNMQMYRAQAALKLCPKSKLTLIYSLLRANELVPASATYSFSGTGKTRGSLYQAKLDYTFNKNVAGYILGEYFDPGNFYTSTADAAVFVRTQIEIKF
jgi:hypothetical protein